MSGWDAYVENLLAGKVCEFGALVGQDGNIWASNFGVAALPQYQTPVPDQNDPDKTTLQNYDEKAALVQALAHNGLYSHPAGFRLNNQKYYTVNFDEEAGTWYLKKDKGGACIAKTNTAVVIGTFSTQINMDNGVAQNPGEVNKRVIDLAKYLKDSGY